MHWKHANSSRFNEHSETACEQWRDANQRVISAAMKLSVFIPILPRTSRRMNGIYTMEFLALSHINLSHLQVKENGLFRVQVEGLTANSGRTETSCGAEGRKLAWSWFSVRIQTVKAWPRDSFDFLGFKARGVRKVTTGIIGLWRPSVNSDVAFWSFDVGS